MPNDPVVYSNALATNIDSSLSLPFWCCWRSWYTIMSFWPAQRRLCCCQSKHLCDKESHSDGFVSHPPNWKQNPLLFQSSYTQSDDNDVNEGMNRNSAVQHAITGSDGKYFYHHNSVVCMIRFTELPCFTEIIISPFCIVARTVKQWRPLRRYAMTRCWMNLSTCALSSHLILYKYMLLSRENKCLLLFSREHSSSILLVHPCVRSLSTGK